MPINLELPLWMIERIVAILGEHPYTGAPDIIQRIKEQVDSDTEEVGYAISSNSSMAL